MGEGSEGVGESRAGRASEAAEGSQGEEESAVQKWLGVGEGSAGVEGFREWTAAGAEGESAAEGASLGWR